MLRPEAYLLSIVVSYDSKYHQETGVAGRTIHGSGLQNAPSEFVRAPSRPANTASPAAPPPRGLRPLREHLPLVPFPVRDVGTTASITPYHAL